MHYFHWTEGLEGGGGGSWPTWEEAGYGMMFCGGLIVACIVSSWFSRFLEKKAAPYRPDPSGERGADSASEDMHQ